MTRLEAINEIRKHIETGATLAKQPHMTPDNLKAIARNQEALGIALKVLRRQIRVDDLL